MNSGRTSDDVTILLEDTEHALANRVRDLEEQKKAADKELSNVGPIKISRTGGDSGSQPATQQNTDN